MIIFLSFIEYANFLQHNMTTNKPAAFFSLGVKTDGRETYLRKPLPNFLTKYKKD